MVMHLYVRLVSIICTSSSIVEPGTLLTRMVDTKFEYGYLINVEMDSEQWKGMLYYPSESELSNNFDKNHSYLYKPECIVGSISHNALWDPTRFEENGIGYRYFHAEICRS